MIVSSRRAAYLDAAISFTLGLAILIALARSPYPADVVTNYASNPWLSVLSAVVCAVGFAAFALFTVAGVRLSLAYRKRLELTAEGLRIESWHRNATTYEYSDAQRLVAIPSAEEIEAWVIEFADGGSFAADRTCENFTEGFEWLTTHLHLEIVEMNLGQYDPSRRTPAWLMRLIHRFSRRN